MCLVVENSVTYWKHTCRKPGLIFLHINSINTPTLLSCIDRCMCPPEAPFLNHGSCTKACPGRRYAPAIIQGFSNRNVPEGQEVQRQTSESTLVSQVLIYKSLISSDRALILTSSSVRGVLYRCWRARASDCYIRGNVRT